MSGPRRHAKPAIDSIKAIGAAEHPVPHRADWVLAMVSLEENCDLRPLAALLRSGHAPPVSTCEELADLLDPRFQVAPEHEPPRLVYEPANLSKRAEGRWKIAERVLLRYCETENMEVAVADIAEELEKSESTVWRAWERYKRMRPDTEDLRRSLLSVLKPDS